MPQIHAPRLRILLDPIYVSVSNLNSSSTYHKYVSLVRELVRRGHFVYWCIPDKEYVPADIEKSPQVGVVRTTPHTDQFLLDGLVTDKFFDLFNRMAGVYHVDILCTSRVSLGLPYKRTLEAPRFFDVDKVFTDKTYGLPLVIIEEFPQTIARSHTSRSYWLSQCTGYFAADTSVFLSDHNRAEITKAMMDFFRPSLVDEWATHKTKIVPAGIECAELDQYYDADRWRVEDGFHVVSIGRLFGESYIEYLLWFDYLFRGGMSDATLTISLSGNLAGPMRHKLTTAGFDLDNLGKQYKLYQKNNRSNFLRMLKRFHCFVAPMSHLDHPTGIFEAMYLGLPGIMPVSDYQQTFFRDYPFVIKPNDKEQFVTILKWIKDNKGEAREMVRPWRDRIRELYDAPTNIRLLADEIEKTARDKLNGYTTSKGVIKMLRELKGEEYTRDDLIQYLKKSGRFPVSVGKMHMRTTFTYSRAALHHAMREVGYVDTCEGPIEHFVRRDIFESRPVRKPRIFLKRPMT